MSPQGWLVLSLSRPDKAIVIEHAGERLWLRADVGAGPHGEAFVKVALSGPKSFTIVREELLLEAHQRPHSGRQGVERGSRA